MNKSILIAFLLIFSSSIAFAQKNVNNYKYVIVPKQYEFQKSEDKYQINSLTKFLFERAGFIAYFSTDKFPEELANNGCMALKAIVKNNSGMLSTKLNIELVDCYNNIVFSTSEAKSKEKEYKKAYQAAIRKAFEDIEALNYSYNPKNVSEVKNIQVKAEKQENITVAEVEPKVDVAKTEEAAKITNTTSIKKEIIDTQNNVEAINNKTSSAFSIEGVYLFDTWGKSRITKKNNEYLVVGGDENVELATIYSTSKPSIYIIKWRAFKQPQLVEINTNGNLSVDTATGNKVYKRVE